jgi:hypothetical protein
VDDRYVQEVVVSVDWNGGDVADVADENSGSVDACDCHRGF